MKRDLLEITQFVMLLTMTIKIQTYFPLLHFLKNQTEEEQFFKNRNFPSANFTFSE